MSSGGHLGLTRRQHAGTQSGGPRLHDPRENYAQGGQGFARQRTCDRRVKPDRDAQGGYLDARLVEVKWLDPQAGMVWEAREGRRLRGFVPGDWNDMTYDQIYDRGDASGKQEQHWVVVYDYFCAGRTKSIRTTRQDNL